MIKNKSQVEMIGITFIVVLVLLAFLFVIYFLLRPEAKPGGTVEHSLLAHAWLLAFTSTTVPECKDQPFKKLIIDCARYGGTEAAFLCDDEERSCEKINKTLNYTISETLEKWKKDYYFNFTGNVGWVLGDISFGKTCPGKRETTIMPIPTGVGTVNLNLDLCIG